MGGGYSLSHSSSNASKHAQEEVDIPNEIQMLLDLKRTIPGLTVVVTESARMLLSLTALIGLIDAFIPFVSHSCFSFLLATAFEMARVLNVKNKGAFNQGWVGDLVSVLEAATADTRSQSSRTKKVIVTWTLGQMFSIVGDDLKQRRWAARGIVPAALSELPWLPSKLRVAARPGGSNARQIAILQALLTCANEVVSAVEPDAEGELLFRDLLAYLGIASRSFKRAWLRSRTDSDVIEAFSNLMDGRMLDPLATYAACSRAADHITGVNYSALVSGSASPRPELVVTKDGAAAVRGLGRAFLAQAPADMAPPMEDVPSESIMSPDTHDDHLPNPEDPLQESQHLREETPLVTEEDPETLITKPIMRRSSPLSYQESVYNVGRLQTPFLRLIVERFIQNYQATRTQKMEPTYTIVLMSSMRDRSDNVLTIPWVWCGREPDINRTWAPPQWSSFLSGSPVSLTSSDGVSQIANSLTDELRVVHESNRNVVLPAPRLFNLASLQVEASKKLGLTPHSTLVIAMQLFDARVISFPKTSCETMPPRLSSEYLSTVLVWSKASRYRIFSDVVSPRARISASRRDPKIFRESSSLEHHAIVPVLPSQKADAKVIDAYLSKLNDAQKRLLDLIVSRLFESCMPDSECQEVDLVASSNNIHYFSTKVSFAIRDGWQRIQTIAAETLMAPRKGRQRQAVPVATEVAEKVATVLDSGPSRSYLFLTSPPFVALGDSVPVLPPSAFSRVIDVSSQDTKSSKLLSDAELVQMISDPTPDIPSGAGIGDVATRSAALQQLIHWKYVSHKNGHYVPTRRGIRLAKLVSDEPISYFTHLTQQESQLRIAAASMEPDVAMDSLKREIKEAVAPIAARGHVFMPYDIDSFHASQGAGTFELKIVRSETCPKCRHPGTLIMGISSVFCNHSTCNFAFSTTVLIRCTGSSFSDSGHFDLIVEMATAEKVRLLRGEHVLLQPKKSVDVSAINVEVQPPQLLGYSVLRSKPTRVPSPPSPSVPRIKMIEAYLDPTSRYELVLVNASDPTKPVQMLPTAGSASLPMYQTASFDASQVSQAADALMNAIRKRTTAPTSLWDEWVGDAEFIVPPLIPENSGRSFRPIKQSKQKASPKEASEPVQDPVTRVKLKLDAIKLKRRLALLTEKEKNNNPRQ
jgi:DNA topoisomerase IA